MSSDEMCARWWRRIGAHKPYVTSVGTKRIFRKDVCSFCGSAGGTLDHILPKKVVRGHDRGDYMNYTGACQSCNVRKGGGHFLFFFAMVQGRPVEGHTFNPRGQA